MKVLSVVLPLGLLLAGCEKKPTATELAAAQRTAAEQQAAAQKKKNWMWDKGRGNPLEQAPQNVTGR